jgi:hypothetical protein
VKSKVNVVPVRQAPKLMQPLIQLGIRDKTAAEAWAVKNGFTTVYFIEGKQKVYGERVLARVDELAKDIEQASVELVEMAEAAV